MDPLFPRPGSGRGHRVRPAAVLLGIAGLAAGFPPLAAAQDRAARAAALAESAQVLLDEGKLDEALDLFRKAHALDPVPELLYNVARVCDRKGDLSCAREGYEGVVSAASDGSLRQKASARLAEVLDRIPGRLLVRSDPDGASVLVDGKPGGRGGQSFALRRGPHRVEVRLDGYSPEAREVEIEPDRQSTIQVKLRPLPGAIAVECACPGAAVSLDGTPAGILPLSAPVPASAGRHVIEVRRPGAEPFVGTVEVRPGATVRLDVKLAAPGTPASRDDPAPRVDAQSTPPRRALSPWPWVTVGAGAAAVIAGGVLTWSAGSERDAVSGAGTWPDGTRRMTRETAVAHQGAAAKLDAAAIAMYAVGGAAIAGGVVWAILDARSGRSVTVAPTGAGASMTVSFR